MLALLGSCQFPLYTASQPFGSNFCQSTSQALIKRGGTSWGAAIGFILMFMVVVTVVIVTVAVLFGKV
jgi:hypothetical protein